MITAIAVLGRITRRSVKSFQSMQNEVITFDKLFARETSSCQERGAAGCLYALLCPAALAEKDDADEHNDGLRNNDGDENAVDAHEGVHGQPPG